MNERLWIMSPFNTTTTLLVNSKVLLRRCLRTDRLAIERLLLQPGKFCALPKHNDTRKQNRAVHHMHLFQQQLARLTLTDPLLPGLVKV